MEIGLKKIIIFLYIFLSTILLVIYLSESPLFFVTNIEVYGNNKMLKEDIIEKLMQFKNEPLAYVKSSMIEESILKDARVYDVDIKKKYPGTLIVKLNERKPAAIVRLKKLFVVDNNLNIFAHFEEVKSNNLIIVDTPNDIVDKNNLSSILKELEKSDMYNVSSELKRFDKYYQVILFSGVRVYLDKDITEKKINKAYSIYKKELEKKDIEYVDLRFNSKVIIK